MEKAFLKITTIEIDFADGITIGLGKIEPVREGWVVKLPEWQNFEGQDGMYKAIEIAQQTTKTVSGVKFDNTQLWDVVEIFEGEDDATKAGKEYGQMTIYQIETGFLKWID